MKINYTAMVRYTNQTKSFHKYASKTALLKGIGELISTCKVIEINIKPL